MKKISALIIVGWLALAWSPGAGAQTQTEPEAPPADSGGPAPGTVVTMPPRVPANVRLLEEGYVNYRLGHLKKAEQFYTQLIRARGLHRSQRAVAYLLRGETRRDLNQIDDALADFTRALKQWPNYPQAFFFRAQVYEYKGLWLEALADFNRAAELDSTREDYQNRLTLLKRKMADQGWVIQNDQPPLPLDAQGAAPEAGEDEDLY